MAARRHDHTSPPAPRALQLDAHRLDDELRASHAAALASLFARAGRHALSPALAAAFTALWHHGLFVFDDAAQPAGLALFGLRYARASAPRRALFLALSVAAPLLPLLHSSSSSSVLPSSSASSRVGPVVTALRAAGALVALVATLARPCSSSSGVASTMTMTPPPPALAPALAGLRVVGHPAPQTDLLDRQLLLSAAADLALAMLPAFRLLVAALRSSRRTLSSGRRQRHRHQASTGDGSGRAGHTPRSSASMLELTATMNCVLCRRAPSMPHLLLPCRCVACYFCAAAAPPPACPRCGAAVAAHTRLTYA